MPMLMLPPAECMRRYHDPHLQGLFAHKYPDNGFGLIQPRGNLRLSIMPPDFQWFPALATEALKSLAREDLTPGPSLNKSTDTEAATHVHQLCMQLQAPDPEVLKQTVLDILAEGGHCHLLLPNVEDYPSCKGSEVDSIDTPLMSPSRRLIIDMVQRMRLEACGLTANDLLNPAKRTPATPLQDVATSPVKKSPTSLQLTKQMSGWQMDANRNQRAHLKCKSSPVTPDPNKWAKIPTREDDMGDQTRRSRSTQR